MYQGWGGNGSPAQAVADGAEIENASIYGLLQASIEVGTESLFGGIPAMNKGAATKGLYARGPMA